MLSTYLSGLLAVSTTILSIYAVGLVLEIWRPAQGTTLAGAAFNSVWLVIYEAFTILLVPIVVACTIEPLRSTVPSAFGLVHSVGIPSPLLALVVYLLVFDFFYYWFHRLQHTSTLLWAQHRLHHTETHLNVTTTNRHHWLEEPFRVVFIALPMSVLFDVPPVTAGMVAGLFKRWAYVIHMNFRLSLGPFSRVLAGPQLHRIHHSREAIHQDRNFAAFYPLWDILFGTYHHPGRDEYPLPGIPGERREPSVTEANLLPFREYTARLRTWWNGAGERTRATVIAIAIGLFLLEGTCRVLFPLPAIVNFNRISYSPASSRAPGTARQALMNTAFVWESEPDHASSTVYLNLYGFRDRDWQPADHSRHRTIFVGDSFTEGLLATESESIPRVYERAQAQAGHPTEVLNLGVAGTGLDDYLPLVRDAMEVFRPDEVFVVLYANDLPGLHPLGPENTDATLQPKARSFVVPRFLQIVRRIVAGQPIPLRWSAPPFRFLPVVPDPANPWTANAAELGKLVTPRFADYMKRAAFNPFAVNELYEYEYQFRQPVDATAHLRRLRDLCLRHGAALRLLYLPYPAQVSDYYIPFRYEFGASRVPSLSGPEYQIHAAHLTRTARSLQIPFLDLTPILRGAEDRGQHAYWDYDHHMRPSGYALVGNTIALWHNEIQPKP